jgi:hypothetical protein
MTSRLPGGNRLRITCNVFCASATTTCSVPLPRHFKLRAPVAFTLTLALLIVAQSLST